MPDERFTRRQLLSAAATGLAALSGGRAIDLAAQSPAAPAPGPGTDLALVNGRFVDGRGMVASTIAIRNGRIARVGAGNPLAPDARTIDLGGRTVIPGLFDAHAHYTRAAVSPGYDARRIERAFSIAELQEAIARRAASAPAGAFITCIGGWNHTQLKENRRPTKAELDAAASAHGIYISGTGGGTGAITNSVGAAFFASRGVMVDDATGVVSAANPAVTALQTLQTDAQRLRGTSDLNAHANGLGLTGVINAGNLPDQEFALQLWRQGSLTMRMRPLFPADSAEQVETRLANNFSQDGRSVGDDLFRVAGFGERIGGNDTMSSTFEPAARVIARRRWLLQQHSISLQENDFHLKVFQSIARDHPIMDLRWSLIHLQSIDEPRLRALAALGAGASAQTWTYFGSGGGPPFRRIVDSGIRAGVGTDSTNVSALDPWVSIFYMTTGRNVSWSDDQRWPADFTPRSAASVHRRGRVVLVR